MRDGRVAYDGAPLAHADVHAAHHRSAHDLHADHAPHVASPLETGEEESR
jgi:zinc transport system ATP-binding protein